MGKLATAFPCSAL